MHFDAKPKPADLWSQARHLMLNLQTSGCCQHCQSKKAWFLEGVVAISRVAKSAVMTINMPSWPAYAPMAFPLMVWKSRLLKQQFEALVKTFVPSSRDIDFCSGLTQVVLVMLPCYANLGKHVTVALWSCFVVLMQATYNKWANFEF